MPFLKDRGELNSFIRHLRKNFIKDGRCRNVINNDDSVQFFFFLLVFNLTARKWPLKIPRKNFTLILI